jgi:hypothetical protein
MMFSLYHNLHIPDKRVYRYSAPVLDSGWKIIILFQLPPCARYEFFGIICCENPGRVKMSCEYCQTAWSASWAARKMGSRYNKMPSHRVVVTQKGVTMIIEQNGECRNDILKDLKVKVSLLSKSKNDRKVSVSYDGKYTNGYDGCGSHTHDD